MITSNNVHLKDAHKTPQFWLLWLVLCMNVSAGIGIIGAASPMLQETFGGALVGQPELGYLDIKKDAALLAAAAARRRRLRRAHLAVQHLRPHRAGRRPPTSSGAR